MSRQSTGADSGYFNPRPREEGDPKYYMIPPKDCNFNPRPREEGDVVSYIWRSLSDYFNPRPREEGDRERRGGYSAVLISIHALVKRATIYLLMILVILMISIHALVKRATVNAEYQSVSLTSISIHALVKRATLQHHYYCNLKLAFQSTPS